MRTNSWIALSGLLLMLLTATAAGASDTFVYEIVGGWTVRTDRSRNYDCYAEASFDGASHIRIGFDSGTDDTYLMFADPSWQPIEEGREYRLAIGFSDGKSWTGNATGRSFTVDMEQRGLYVSPSAADENRLVESFMRAPSIELAYENHEPVVLSLSGSYRATELLRECQAAMDELRS